MKIKPSLKKILFLNNIIIILIPLIIFFPLIYYFLTQNIEEEIKNKNLQLSRSLAGEINILLDAHINMLRQLIYDIEKGGLRIGSYRISLYLQSIVENHVYFTSIMIIDKNGKVKNIFPYNQDYLNIDMTGQHFYNESKKTNNITWAPATISIDTGHPSTILSIPYKDGIIAGYLDLSSLKNIIERLNLGKNGYAMVLDQTGTVIAHTDFRLVSEQTNIKGLDFIKKGFEGKNGIYTYHLAGAERLACVTLIPKTGWLAVVSQPIQEVLAPINQIKTLLIAGLAVLILFALLISIAFSRRLTKPLILFKEKTKMIADGDYTSSIETTELNVYSEIDELAKNFNKMAEAIKNREESLRFAQFSIDNAYEAICWGDHEGRLLYVNEASSQMFGFKKEDVINKYLYDLDINFTKEEFINTFKKLKDYGSLNFETVFKKADGNIFPADVTSSILNYGGREYFFAFIRDITLRKLAEKGLFEEKELLSVTLRSIGDGVISTDIEGKVKFMNKMAENITGWQQNEANGQPIEHVIHVSDFKTESNSENQLNKIIEISRMKEYFGKHTFLGRDGSKKNILLTILPFKDSDSKIIGMVFTLRDITEQIRLEEEMLRADKLESIGILAGGIAHDFNNLLTGILGNIELAKIFIGNNHPAYNRIEVAEKAIERSKDITQQLLIFSKGGAPLKKASSIEQIIRDSAMFSLRGSGVKCEFSIAEDIPPVEVDEGQMSRVINNLVINAAQSMPDGGIISISIENAHISKSDKMPIEEGEYVLITVRDHGIGIPEENLNKIFDPYFTTKKRGSGLGLAVVYSIIKNHKGLIRVDSKINEGTAFKIYLPSAKQKVITTEVEKKDELTKGKGKILVMDDEDIIRDVAKELLNHLGYEVVLSADGEEAFNLYKQAKETEKPFDAIIMDLTVPGAMGGKDLMQMLLRYDPQVKAIVSSGYSNDPIMAFYKDFGFCGVIMKPYRIKEFSEVLHKVINSNER